MKFELKDFQGTSARAILDELDEARIAAAKGKLQAVVLSAPTGSGKTITVAAVIDWLLGGEDGIVPRPQTTFLWLSDSPELNQQSKGKLMAACENLRFDKLHTVESDSFDEEHLQPGCLYFINTQLLGKDKLLTKGGDKKTFTFCQTVANTIAAAPEDFILIIDEAHRGAGVTDRSRKPIMQKFITGSEADGLPPVPLVLGMSATPQRFTELLGNTSRTQRPVNITPEMVRESGLLKDLIVATCPKTHTESDLTLLENAAARWKQFRDRWEGYCTREKEREMVRPVLVVQVEDGSGDALTRTPLHDVVKVIERQTGALALNEIVHCFQDKEEIQYGQRIIRRMDASRIQDAQDVKVVLFKTALTTGWDCPRAEVMMSFRRAQDPTSIAQLVGRMIRTPLARRIESDEALNTVDLFLPHYDKNTLEAVLAKLRSPDEHDGVPTRTTTEAVDFSRNPAFAAVFDHLATLPTYSINRAPRMSDVKRALRLAGLLVHEGIDKKADERMREKLTGKLRALGEGYAAQEENWRSHVREGAEIEVDVMRISVGGMMATTSSTTKLVLSQENIDQLFDEAGRMLAAGEGLHRTYWKRHEDKENPGDCKLELFAIVRKGETLGAMEKLARKEFDALWAANKDKIRDLPESERARFHHLIQTSGNAVAQEWELPQTIVEKPGDSQWQDHLFVDETGGFSATLNSWETDFLESAMQEDDFVCWLRNLDRRQWAFCVPYELAGEKPFYPDFLIVRKKGKSFEVDVLEPHDDSRNDTWAKAKGLARFAEKHGMSFGRLMIGRKKDGKMQVVDVSEPSVRKRALQMSAAGDLESLFDDYDQ
jgi:type III restriction enzyme